MNNKFDSNFAYHSKRIDRGFQLFWIFWVISAVLGISVMGVLIWAVIRLVLKYS